MRGTAVRLAAVSAAVCAALALAGVANADSGARPLNGDFASNCTGSSTCLTFSGHLTHLGRFSGQITSVATGGQPGCNEPGAAACTTATWTAANGDTINVSSVFFITGVDPSTGLYTFSQAITINRGSGRFADATGTATATGETSATFSTYFGNISGTIGY